MAGTRRERARRQRLWRRRQRLARAGIVSVTVLVMMAPSLRAPADSPALDDQFATVAQVPRGCSR